MDDVDSSGALWRERIRRAGSIERTRAEFARLVDEDDDPAEVYYYEAVCDPDARRLNKTQRSYAGQYERRLRRLRAEDRARNIHGMI